MMPIEFQAALAVASVGAAIAGLLYVRRLVRRSGRDRPHYPARVDRFVESVLGDR